jgi:hypothetical protein
MMSSKINNLENTLKTMEGKGFDYSHLFDQTLKHETKMIPVINEEE